MCLLYILHLQYLLEIQVYRNYKIGIIGAIGSELESSIATNRIAPYEFVDPLPLIKEYAKKLKQELGCTLVVLSVHDNTTGINQEIADMKDEYQIDAVFNGHTHSTYAGDTMGSDGVIMPYIQIKIYITMCMYQSYSQKIWDS